MAAASASVAEDKRRVNAAGPTTTEWRRRSYLRVRRPAWTGRAVGAKKS